MHLQIIEVVGKMAMENLLSVLKQICEKMVLSMHLKIEWLINTLLKKSVGFLDN